MNLRLPFLRKRETPEQRLQRLVEETLASYECQQFRRRRDAAKLGWKRKRGAA
jgi:hypothetical protein